MKTIVPPSALGFLLALCLHAAPAEAQQPVSYVAPFPTGSENNDCQFTSTPCNSFQRAHDRVINGGFIICLGSSRYGAVLVNKSITIHCKGHVAQTEQITVEGANVAVTLRGLEFDNFFVHGPAIDFRLGQELHIEHSTITGATGGSFPAGIYFRPAGGGRLFVTDSTVSLNGSAANGGGIIIQPTGSGNTRVVLNRVQVTNNTVGIISIGGGGTIIVEVRDSAITGNHIMGANSHGIFSQSSSGLSAIVIDRSSINLNFGNGIMAQGPGTLVHIGRSTVRGNGGGLVAGGGASILSYGDNHTKGNGNDGGPTGVLAPN